MFGRNPLANALEIIHRHPLIQSFLTRHQLTHHHVNCYIWYSMINLKDEDALKEYLRILINMVKERKLDTATLMQLLQAPNHEDRNIGEVIAETFTHTESIMLLTDLLEGMSREQFIQFLPCTYRHFRNFQTKEDLFNTVDWMTDVNQCIQYCLRALDENSPLGYIMYLQRGCYPCSITEGTLGDFLDTLSTAVEAKRAVQEVVNIVEEVCKKANASKVLSKPGVFSRAVRQMSLNQYADQNQKPERAPFTEIETPDEDYWPTSYKGNRK